MSDPSAEAPVAPVDRLPMDIWREILFQLNNCVDYQLCPYPHLVMEKRFPAAICAVNRRWYERFTPLLYHRFYFGYMFPDFKRLWYFLRTLVGRPDLAALVKDIAFFSPRSPRPLIFLERPDVKQNLAGLYAQNKDMVRQAMIQARFDLSALPGGDFMPFATKYLSCDVQLELDKTYHQNHVAALQALILAHASNITRLSMQTFPNDPFLERILYLANAPIDKNTVGLAFQKLEVLNIAPNNVRDPYLGGSKVIRNGQTVLSGKRQYQRLPKLKEFTFLEGRIEYNAVQDKTALQKLCLPEIDNYIGLIEPLLGLSSDLRQLSISSSYEKGPKFHHKFWPTIMHLKDQLEYLDFFEPNHDYMPNQIRYFYDVDKKLSFCPPLAEFTKLRVLKTTPLILYGYKCSSHETPRKLRSHMPPNLESLGLYTKRSMWLTTHIPHLESELEGIVLDATPRQKLSHITVDCPDRLPFTKMRIAAAQRNIPFIGPSEGMAYGGRGTTFAHQATPMTMAADIQMSLNREDSAAAMLPKGMRVHTVAGTMVDVYGHRKKRQLSPIFREPRHKRARAG
ncbi:hypothetical protein BJY01DRAFT_248899 [Aspergillus pseudoustus]|uniref:F-box domain-containing protein n=1 Tax=Aspergillus pseudoustus TaxID=1810923 RepID=A0ABR4JRT1_9EURO